jgi:hypothetical protein
LRHDTHINRVTPTIPIAVEPEPVVQIADQSDVTLQPNAEAAISTSEAE